MITTTAAKARCPPRFIGSITQATIVTPRASESSRTGRIAAFPCGCRWRTTSSWSVSTSSGNATGSAYVHDVAGRDAMVTAVSRTDHQLTVGVHRGRLAGHGGTAGQQDAYAPADGGAPPPVGRQEPAQLRIAVRLTPVRVPAGEAAQQGSQQRIAVGVRGAGDLERGGRQPGALRQFRRPG